MHGTLELIPLAWKFNSKQHLSNTLNSRMNIIETRAVLNIVQKYGKWAPEVKQERAGIIQIIIKSYGKVFLPDSCITKNIPF